MPACGVNAQDTVSIKCLKNANTTFLCKTAGETLSVSTGM